MRARVIIGIAGLALAFGAVAVVSTAAEPALLVWPAASELSLSPPGTNTTAGGQDASLGSVACTSPGNCVAGGQRLNGV